jgi:heme/copper-type cytochrome/quinol oxidase subunit 2
METATAVLNAVEYWGYAGFLTALVFLGWGMDRVEPNARTSFIFRPLLLPGVVILWPLVLWRWWQLESGRDRPHARHQPPRLWHKRFWIVFACAIPAILILGLLVRQDGPYERPAVQLEKAQ